MPQSLGRCLSMIRYIDLVSVESSSQAAVSGVASNDVRAVALDDTDRLLLRTLAEDARMPNNALAARAGIAASTCLGRVRALRERGVIRGYHADIDPKALGQNIQAMIAVRLQAHARGHISEFARKVVALPEVRNVFFLAGAVDFYVHIAAPSTEALRDFVVDNLSADPDVALTETNLIFEHVRGDVPLS